MTSVGIDPHVAAIRQVRPRTQRLRGMPAARHTVGPPAAVPDLRARRLLRLVTDAACPSARAHGGPPDRAVHGARRELALVLRP